MKQTPFQAIVDAMKRAQPTRDQPTRARPRVPYAKIKARADRDFASVMQLIKHGPRVHGLPPIDDMSPADAIAAQIIEAARIRDRGGHDLPKLTGEAAAIIRAGKVRRGEPV